MNDIITHEQYNIGYEVIGPCIYAYVFHVLEDAKKNCIKTIYFLARDAYVAYLIADMIVSNSGKEYSDIKVKYLYVSRLALRLPTYHFIGDEKFDLLFDFKSERVSFSSLLLRAGIKDDDKNKLSNNLLNYGDEKLSNIVTNDNKELNDEEYNYITEILKKDSLFENIVNDISKKAYINAKEYFIQEGLLEGDFAIVDSGWSGSIQRNLSHIMKSLDFKYKIKGYYFGLYKDIKKEDGDYDCFYFSYNSHLLRKVYFYHIIFECLLSANHEMTIGYKYDNEEKKYTPIFKEKSDNNYDIVNAFIRGVTNYVRSTTNQKIYNVKEIEKILKQFMFKPTTKEVDAFKNFYFYDDVSGKYPTGIVDDNSRVEYSFLYYRIKAKLCKKKIFRESLWPNALIIRNNKLYRFWAYVNILLCKFIRTYALVKRNGG